jgi:predicted PurR-regulated permease PerM
MTTTEVPFIRWRFWLIAFAIFGLLLWTLSSVLLPFVAGLALAYFLDPLVDRLDAWGVNRGIGAVIALVLFTCAFGVLLVLLVPLLQSQLSALMQQLPTYAEKIRTDILPWLQDTLGAYLPATAEELQAAAGTYAGDAAGVAGNVLKTVLSGGLAVFDTLALLVVTPIVAFYMLRDWDQLIAAINNALPLHSAATIRAEAKKVDDTLAGFLRGQAMVCVCLGAYYAIALSLAGLEFGATVGIVAGALSFIPYVGSIVGLLASMGLAFAQFDDMTSILIILAIYVVGQTVEGNVLAPKLVGDRVGLHPVWVIFALMAGASLFGFLGVLVALPVAAVLGVLVRFAINQYLNSKYYKLG